MALGLEKITREEREEDDGEREFAEKDWTSVRPPRVQITYDVETGGAIQKKELPFVAGVLADLSAIRRRRCHP